MGIQRLAVGFPCTSSWIIDAHLEFAREMLRDGTESQWQMELCQQVDGDLAALELQIADKTLE